MLLSYRSCLVSTLRQGLCPRSAVEDVSPGTPAEGFLSGGSETGAEASRMNDRVQWESTSCQGPDSSQLCPLVSRVALG